VYNYAREGTSDNIRSYGITVTRAGSGCIRQTGENLADVMVVEFDLHASDESLVVRTCHMLHSRERRQTYHKRCGVARTFLTFEWRGLSAVV
jgi:hypothetical protein